MYPELQGGILLNVHMAVSLNTCKRKGKIHISN